MTKKKNKTEEHNDPKLVSFVRFQINIMGQDGIEVQYPYGWVNAEKVVSFDTVPERMDYLLGFVEVYGDYVVFNGDTKVPREGIMDGVFEVIGDAHIYDFTGGKEYFSDKSFGKLVEWCEEYERKRGPGSADKEGNTDR